MINVGDIFLVGKHYRILVWNGIDSYFFINIKGEQATDNFKSLEEVQLYCDNRHPKNDAKDYKDRIYEYVGNLNDCFMFKDKTDDCINDCFIGVVKNINKIGVDKVKHIIASRTLFTLGGDNANKMHEDPLLIFVSAFFDTLRIGIEKEFKDANLKMDDYIKIKKYFTTAENVLLDGFNEMKKYSLDEKDIWANILGIGFGVISLANRELLFKEKE